MAFKVCLSPSNQTDNPYAVGATTEAVQCGRIADAAQAALTRCGIQSIVPHLNGMSDKCAQSDAFGAQLHVPIHSNASVSHTAVGTRLYCSKFGAKGHEACKAIFKYLGPLTPSEGDVIKEAPDLFEIRVPVAPTAYIEVDFHDVPTVAHWIIAHAIECGEAIAHGICDYFGVKYIGPDETPAPVEQPKPESTKTRYRVIVQAGRAGSYASEDNAKSVWQSLTNLGAKAYIEKVELPE